MPAVYSEPFTISGSGRHIHQKKEALIPADYICNQQGQKLLKTSAVPPLLAYSCPMESIPWIEQSAFGTSTPLAPHS